jgi:hypothetical protein
MIVVGASDRRLPTRSAARPHTVAQQLQITTSGSVKAIVAAHLGSDLVEGPGQEVGGAHPSFEGPKRVFDGLSSHAHGLGHSVEPILHPVEHVLILPALDAPQLGRRAAGFERTGEAGAQAAVEIEVFGVIRPALGLGECCARRAGVMIVLSVVDEVLPVKNPRLAPLDVSVLGTTDATPVPSQDRIWSPLK